jgi:hypothetical protein
MTDEANSTDKSVRACTELFELFQEICGGSSERAATLWGRTFWFKFDGKNPPNIPEGAVPKLAGWINGATMLLKAQIESGFFEK